jgi:hypothetical protein
MENPMVYHVMPDTAMSVLEMFQPTKEGIALFAARVINDVEDGKVDPLHVQLLCKTLEEISDKIKAGIKENLKTEAAKYGEKPFMFQGAEFHLTHTKTEYDFSVCGDPQWEAFDQQEQSCAHQRKERETFLKALKEPMDMLDSLSGEIVTLRPPVKKQYDGVKVSIK